MRAPNRNKSPGPAGRLYVRVYEDVEARPRDASWTARSGTGASAAVPLDTLTVDPAATSPTTGHVTLHPGTRYTMNISGTFQEVGREGYGFQYDAMYCYAGVGFDASAGPQCQHTGNNDHSNRGGDFGVRVGNVTGAPDDFGSASTPAPDQAGEVPYDPSHSYTFSFFAPQTGKLQAGGPFAFKPCPTCGTKISGGPIVIKIFGPGPSGGGGPPTTCAAPRAFRAHPARVNEVHVSCVSPDVQFHKGGTPADAWLPLEPGQALKAGDDISCDPDGVATLAFADGSTAEVRNTTQLKIGSFFTEGGVVKTEILLKMGEVSALVNRSEATKSDFRIKNPTAVASVRDAPDMGARAAAKPSTINVDAGNGASFTVFHAPGSNTVLVSNHAGPVAVTPAGPKARPFQVPAGDEADLTPKTVSALGPIGHVGLRGGIDVLTAQNLVSDLVGRNRHACHDDTAHSYAFSITPAAHGWTVAVALGGRTRGAARFSVSGQKVTPANALARKVAGGCR